MHQVPQRNLSNGEILTRQRLADKQKHETPGTLDFPTYEAATKAEDGPVAIYQDERLPNPLKCGKCEYVAGSRRDLNLHWIDEH